MRRFGDRRRFQRSFLKREKPLREPIQLGAGLFDHLPLFGELIGKLLYRLRLVREDLFEMSDAVVVSGQLG